MPYVEGQWEDGKSGSTYEATAAKMKNIEKGISTATLEAEEGARVNVAKYGVKTSATGVANVKGINEAIAALPTTGGVLFFPERGLYLLGKAGASEPINAEKTSGVVLLGQGGVSAGGGLGYPKGGLPAVNFPPTYLAYEGNGPSVINAKKTTGFGLENLEIYAFKKKFGEENGYVLDVSESNFMYTNNVTLQCVSDTTMVLGKLMRLDNSNCGLFIRTWFKGGKEAVIGRLLGGGEDFSYAHCFIGGGTVAQTAKSIVNIHNGWSFTNFAFEPHYNAAGTETGAGEGWIGPSAVNMEALGLTLTSCFFGAAPGKESGNAIEFLGNGLSINGGEIACAENAIVIPQKSNNISLTPHINLCKNGLVIAAEGKESSRIFYRPSFGETFAKGAITAMVLTGKPKGAILQTAAGNTWGTIASPAETLAALKKAVDELRELQKSLGFME